MFGKACLGQTLKLITNIRKLRPKTFYNIGPRCAALRCQLLVIPIQLSSLRYDTQHNDALHNDIHHNDTKYNDILPNATKQTLVMLNVVADDRKDFCRHDI
jgi:hypothetical protein